MKKTDGSEPTRAGRSRPDPKLTDFIAWITPWLTRDFEEPLAGLLREIRGFHRSDEAFRTKIKAGDNRGAKKELKELLGLVD